jgi:hypothetical protein
MDGDGGMSTPWDHGIATSEAAIRLIQSTPGATCLGDVERIRNRPHQELLEEEVAQYLLAQHSRLMRYCNELGVSVKAVMAGRLKINLRPICDEHGRIQPEPIDLERMAS